MNNRQLFLKHVAQTSEFPLMLEIASSEGMYLIDSSGKKYMDLISGIGVSGLGHRHPEVVDAIKNQVDKYLHTLVYGEYILSPQVELATLMSENLPENLDSVYFVNSGAEATEGAMKLAKRYTGRSEIIACKNAYHGSTQGAMSLNSSEYFTAAYRPLLPDIQHITYNCEWCLRQITERTAAVIVETVQGESGVQKPFGDYLKKLRARCDETGTLLILDEIQCGYGRTGTLWAFEQYGVVPDVLLLAKGMGGGMPIGAFVASKKIMNVFTDQPILGHITTFGGHPVCCAAALATLKTLLETDFIQKVKKKEALFHELLKHPKIVMLRSEGLMMAAEVSDFDYLQRISKHLIEKGLIVDWFLFNDRSIRIAPPLIITEEEIRWACAQILEALDEVE
jgi:acetylornithine/succinyldiaminopimelate/putrescine aminotransferase